MSHLSFLHSVEPIAQQGFEKNVDFYENARPSYPLEAVSMLVKVLGLIPNESHVVDLGAGTGKFTRLLLPGGYHLSAVEPSQAMREKFTQVLPTVPVLSGNSWDIPLPSGSQDAVICAQSFHWFANIRTLNEVHRVLKPGGGKFAMIWNLEDRSKMRWVGQLRDYYEQFELDSPQYRLGLWKRVWVTEEAKLLFSSPLKTESLQHLVHSTKETIVDRIMSKSYIGCQDVQTQKKNSDNLREILAKAEDIEENEQGLVAFPYKTDVAWCERLGF